MSMTTDKPKRSVHYLDEFDFEQHALLTKVAQNKSGGNYIPIGAAQNSNPNFTQPPVIRMARPIEEKNYRTPFGVQDPFKKDKDPGEDITRKNLEVSCGKTSIEKTKFDAIDDAVIKRLQDPKRIYEFFPSLRDDCKDAKNPSAEETTEAQRDVRKNFKRTCFARPPKKAESREKFDKLNPDPTVRFKVQTDSHIDVGVVVGKENGKVVIDEASWSDICPGDRLLPSFEIQSIYFIDRCGAGITLGLVSALKYPTSYIPAGHDENVVVRKRNDEGEAAPKQAKTDPGAPTVAASTSATSAPTVAAASGAPSAPAVAAASSAPAAAPAPAHEQPAHDGKKRKTPN
jgi:hypothetical protein